MYSAFRSLLDKLEETGADTINFSQEDPKIVLGVLFLIVIKADGKTRPEELQTYNYILDHFLDIREDERHLFEAEVSKRMLAIPDLESLTDSLRAIPVEQKHIILGFMRDISICDQEFHEAEFDVITRAACLLGIDEKKH